MKKQCHALILAALVLGLVCAPLALARDPSSPTFHIINSTGSSITVECSGNPPRPTILSGSTDTLTCNATVVVKMKSKMPLIYMRRIFLLSARAAKFKRLP